MPTAHPVPVGSKGTSHCQALSALQAEPRSHSAPLLSLPQAKLLRKGAKQPHLWRPQPDAATVPSAQVLAPSSWLSSSLAEPGSANHRWPPCLKGSPASETLAPSPASSPVCLSLRPGSPVQASTLPLGSPWHCCKACSCPMARLARGMLSAEGGGLGDASHWPRNCTDPCLGAGP